MGRAIQQALPRCGDAVGSAATPLRRFLPLRAPLGLTLRPLLGGLLRLGPLRSLLLLGCGSATRVRCTPRGRRVTNDVGPGVRRAWRAPRLTRRPLENGLVAASPWPVGLVRWRAVMPLAGPGHRAILGGRVANHAPR